MIDDRTQQQVRHRLLWIQGDTQVLKEKTLDLVAMLTPRDRPLDESQRVLWTEITEHIANIESHVHNALQRVPESEEPPLS